MTLNMASAVHLLLHSPDGALLMLRRANTGFQDGNYSLIAGHVEPGEPASEAMRREATEEAGIDINSEDLEFVHIMHRWSDQVARHDFFFRCFTWSGQAVNAEPHKCSEIEWFRPDDLPGNTVPYIRAAIASIGRGHLYSEFGWQRRESLVLLPTGHRLRGET